MTSERTSDHRIEATPQELARVVLGLPARPPSEGPSSDTVMAEDDALVENPGIEPGRRRL
ncbi:MAG: hypothetical protein F4Z60_07825 [Chloroflexi bacterium]|nr:hypothetical protein [Chloroflexota bacterium]